MLHRECRECGAPIDRGRYANRWYCDNGGVCLGASTRRHDRERKAGVTRVAGEANSTSHTMGTCRQCGSRRELRYDSYGPATDDYLDVIPEFCSAECVVSYWKGKASDGVHVNTSPEIQRLMGLLRPRGVVQAGDDDCDDEYLSL